MRISQVLNKTSPVRHPTEEDSTSSFHSNIIFNFWGQSRLHVQSQEYDILLVASHVFILNEKKKK